MLCQGDRKAVSENEKVSKGRTFDIGGIYERKGCLFIAVQENKLVTCDSSGNFLEYTTDQRHSPYVGELSVFELCEIWEIDVKDLDTYMSKYFTPDEEALEKARSKFEREDEDVAIMEF